jgi:hypothetical protein
MQTQRTPTALRDKSNRSPTKEATKLLSINNSRRSPRERKLRDFTNSNKGKIKP